MSTSAAVEAERNRRERMWKAVEEIQAERSLKSDQVRELALNAAVVAFAELQSLTTSSSALAAAAGRFAPTDRNTKAMASA